MTLIPVDFVKHHHLDHSHLREFYAMNNTLESLLNALGKLSELRILDLQGNRFTILPKCITRLQALTDSKLRFNNLTSLPEDFGILRSLRFLDLRWNKFTTHPTWLNLIKNRD